MLYESPYRVEKLLGELNEVFAGRQVVLARELTKKFEEYSARHAGRTAGSCSRNAR